eukprot:gene11584-7980_t
MICILLLFVLSRPPSFFFLFFAILPISFLYIYIQRDEKEFASYFPLSPCSDAVHARSSMEMDEDSTRVFYPGCFFMDVSRFLIDGENGKVLRAWMAVHPQSYRTVVHLNEDGAVAARSPFFDSDRESVHVRIRTERSGIVLNHSYKMEPLHAATHQLLLAESLWGGHICVELVSLDPTTTRQLLQLWRTEDFAPLLRDIQARGISGVLVSLPEDIGASAVSNGLRGATSLRILGELPGDASMSGVEKLVHLQRLSASGQCIQHLRALTQLTCLQYVDMSSTCITDTDVTILAGLPRLEELYMNDCCHVTSIAPLGSSASPLTTLCASGCSRLFEVGQIGVLPALSTVNLSYMRGHSSLKALLESPCEVRRAVLNYTQFPSPSPAVPVVMPRVEYLSLIGATIVNMEWLLRAPSVQHLLLDRTCVTHHDLVQLCRVCDAIQVMSVCDCERLRTTMEWAVSLPLLTVLHISDISVMESAATTKLRRQMLLIKMERQTTSRQAAQAETTSASIPGFAGLSAFHPLLQRSVVPHTHTHIAHTHDCFTSTLYFPLLFRIIVKRLTKASPRFGHPVTCLIYLCAPMLTCGGTLYSECCKKYSLKPNKNIANQVSRTDLLQLKDIDASQTLLGSLGVHALLDFVEAHRGIEGVNLQQNGVDQTCVEHLCEILLEGHPCLSSLDLSKNPLSTGSTRLLWETIRKVPTVHALTLDECGVPGEWMRRLQHALEANVQAQKEISPAGDAAPEEGWNLIYVLVIGDEMNASRFCDSVLLPLGSYLAGRRVRVAPVVITPEDNLQQIDAKVQMCCDTHNYGLPWCATFVDGTPFAEAQRVALAKVMRIRPPLLPADPKHPAELVVEMKAVGFFPYMVPSSKVPEKAKHITGARWLMMAGFDRTEIDELAPLLKDPGAPVMSSESQLIVRCQSDLFSAVSRIYSDKSNLPPLDEDAELSLEEHRRAGVAGKLQDKAVKAIMYYMNNKDMEATVPMLLYGDPGVGKGIIVSHIAALLMEKGDEEMQVLTYNVSTRPDSVVLFLYFMLSVFNPSATMEYESADQLCLAVKESIAEYAGKPTALLISNLSGIDVAGYDASLVTDWLPHSFPSTVKILITIQNGHPAVGCLRQRCPQPYECLCSVLPARHLVNLYKQELHNRGLTLPGLNDFTRSVRDALTDAESAYLQKEGSSDVVFPRIAAAYTECLTKLHGEPTSEGAVVSLIADLPNTVEKVVAMLCEYISALHNPTAVVHVGLSLAACPLPVTELLLICETLGACGKHSAGVTLREMIHMGLVSWGKGSVASIAHPIIRDAITNQYTKETNRVNVMVEQHLHRLVVTFSPEISWAFRRLVPLMLANGNFSGLRDLLQSSLVLDAVLSASKRNQVYVIDAFFRLLASHDLLGELAAADIPVDVRINASDLSKSLEEVQRHKQNFFQEVLVYGDATSLSRDAQRNTRCANYPLILPTNQGAEDTCTQMLRCDGVCLCCHGRDDYICAGTSETVMVFSVKTGSCMAQRYIPSKGDSIVGVLMAAHSKVVVIGRHSILLWDFPLNNLHALEGHRTTHEAFNISADGELLLAQNLGTGAIEVINLSTKKVVVQVARTQSNFSNARFCGDGMLVRLHHCLHILDKAFAEVSVLQHDGPIITCCGTTDGRLAVTSVGGTFWVWTSIGNLIHRIEAGKCPITAVSIDESGSLLLTTQSCGVNLWKVLSGTRIAKLHTMGQGVPQVHFTKDKSKIVAVTGSVLNVWDIQSGIPVGAVAAPSGMFTSFFEAEAVVYTTATSSEVIRVWNLNHPIPTEKQIQEGTITTNWLKNGKVSEGPIVSISTDPKGQVIGALDSAKQLHVYNALTGDKLELPPGTFTSAIMINHNTIAYTREKKMCVYYYDLKRKQETCCVLPKVTLPDSQLRLMPSVENVYAVSAASPHASFLWVCEVRKNHDEFYNLNQHSGPVLTACFFGSFMYTVGAEDREVHLWTLPRRANRATYKHHLPIISASCTASGILLFIDAEGVVYRLVPESLTSSTRAALVCGKLYDLYPKAKSILTSTMKQVACWSNFAFFVSADKTVAMMDVSKEGPGNHAELRNTSCIHAGTSEDKDFLYVGTLEGNADAGSCPNRTKFVSLLHRPLCNHLVLDWRSVNARSLFAFHGVVWGLKTTGNKYIYIYKSCSTEGRQGIYIWLAAVAVISRAVSCE